MGKYNRKFTFEENTMSWDRNPYYNPVECGLEIMYFAEKEPDYDFEMLVVWKDKATGAIFAGKDSGCSCPTPFEDFDGLDKMTRIKKIEDFDRFLDQHVDSWSSIPQADIRAIRRKMQGMFQSRERDRSNRVRNEKKQAAAV